MVIFKSNDKVSNQNITHKLINIQSFQWFHNIDFNFQILYGLTVKVKKTKKQYELMNLFLWQKLSLYFNNVNYSFGSMLSSSDPDNVDLSCHDQSFTDSAFKLLFPLCTHYHKTWVIVWLKLSIIWTVCIAPPYIS